MVEIDKEDSVFVSDDTSLGKHTRAVPKPEQTIGVDIHNQFYDNIIQASQEGNFDVTAIQQFTTTQNSRDDVYTLIDTMAEDSTVQQVLETYQEDATEYNDQGQIVWAESDDASVQKYVSFLLDTMNVDKHIFSWVFSLCKYGDLYLRLYRKSEQDDPLFKSEDDEKKSLNEDVKIKEFSKNDGYTHYVEMVKNPANVFELTKFGKTCGYIKANTQPKNVTQTQDFQIQQVYNKFKYKFNKSDVDVYPQTEFVHAQLEDNSNRTEEEVDIFLNNNADTDSDASYSYTVRRGQSILYNVFKIWRELQLLENSILLNRLTKSSIVRLIQVEVGDMPKEKIGPHLQQVKQLIEQKIALNTNVSMSEYTNSGPIENSVYIPTHGGIGHITADSIGGDVDVKGLADLDYFKNKFFGQLRVPKQYFGETDDSQGFDSGKSLSLISSRYSKMVKRIQNTVVQALTDAVNLMLIDKGLSNYVNKFTIKMLQPLTQEELDRREHKRDNVGVVSDIMNLMGDVESVPQKLQMLKSMLSNTTTNVDVIQILEDEIDRLEKEQSNEQPQEGGDESIDDMDLGDLGGGQDFGGSSASGSEFEMPPQEQQSEQPQDETQGEETILPSPSELNLDMTNNNQEI